MTDFRVFIVEDLSDLAEMIALTLKSLGYGIAGSAASGEIALQKIPETRPDLVLMDIGLGGKMDGIETAMELQKVCAVPIIYLTAFTDKELLDRAKQTGPYGYLIKPYDERELKAVIEMARYKYEVDKKLKETEETYRALLENTPDILFSTDMTGIITSVSPQIGKFGIPEPEVIGSPIRMLIHPEDVDRFENTHSRELKGGGPFVTEFRILDRWGTTYWLEEKGFLRRDSTGTPVGVYGILHDITDRKRAEEAVELANKKLNLMNNITRHDILNTVTGLLGCVDMARASESAEEREQLLNDIRNLTAEIQRQVAFTKDYQEVGVHLPLWQNTGVVIARVLQHFTAPGTPEIITDLENVEIFADPLLEKVFSNLVDNAIRYGGTISTIRLHFEISDKGLFIICEDDGVGIPPGEKVRIFERGEGRHTGLGLFLTREILGITGITIAETGVYTRGARFEIHVPRGTFRFVR